MTMEHVTITEIDGMYKLVPDEGWMLESVVSHRRYSEAVTEHPEEYIAVAV